MSQWLLFSDLFPVLLFTCCFTREPSLLLAGIIVCRAFSLLFHLFAETRPYLINLDYIGIACMSFATPAVCRASGCPFCDEYELVLAAAFASACTVFAYGLVKKITPRYAEASIICLAVIAHGPSAWAVVATQEYTLLASLSAFAIGFFIVEPRSHIAWHWIAAAGQGLLVWYI